MYMGNRGLNNLNYHFLYLHLGEATQLYRYAETQYK